MDQPSFTTAQVSWQVDDISVEGTLTKPAGEGPLPALVMVAGSGPTDRNWNTPLLPGSNGSANLLAQQLTQAGVVTLRYDKRASGPRAKQNVEQLTGHVSMKSHLDELVGAVKLLASQEMVDPAKIFGLGNSEGCIHILNYQLQHGEDIPDFNKIVLTAPPANPVGLVAHNQIAAQLQAMPEGQQWLSRYDQVVKDFVAGKPVEPDESMPEWLRNIILAITNPVNQPFSRELWVLDPAEQLKKVTVPVLIVIGKKDLQVDWQTEGKIFDSLAEHHKNLTIAYPENANHVLKYEPIPREELKPAEVGAEYNADDRQLDPEALQIILDWLTQDQ